MWFLRLAITGDKANVEIDVGSEIRALAFLRDETPRVVSGEGSTFQLRNLADTMIGQIIKSNIDVLAIAASMDGKWIVTGAADGFTIWTGETGGRDPVMVIHHAISGVRTIDVSSDSKWVVTGSDARTVDVWDLSTGERRLGLGPLKHEYNVVAVKFCPCGERIATATLFGSIRIYAASSGQKILTVPVSVMSTLSSSNITLAWFANRPHIFAVSNGQIKCLNSEDGSLVFQWATRGVIHPSSITLSSNNKLIAYSVNDTVVIRDMVTHQQIGKALQHDGNVSCIAFSPGSDCLVVGAKEKFTLWDLGKLFNKAAYPPDTSIPADSCTHHNQGATQKSPPPTFLLPLMNISNKAVKPWLHGFLKSAEEVLSAEIDSPSPSIVNHNALANRALVRGRLSCDSGVEYAGEALKDAEKSLSIQTSAIGHIAKTIALIRQRKTDLAKQEIPKILDDFHSDNHMFLLKIVQSILFCLSGEYDNQTDHIVKLSTELKDQQLLLLVQANMHLSKKYFEHAMESFRKAHVPTVFPHEETREMWSISFMFGWKFSGLAVQIQQEKCQSLLDNGDPEAAYLFVNIMKTYRREIVLHVRLSDWSRVFRTNCLEKLEGLGDAALNSGDYKEAIRHYTAVEPLIGDSEPKHALLLKRSRAHLELGPDNWEMALRDADEAIRLNKYSPWGYERRHAALYVFQHYREAAESLDQLVQCLAYSMDPKSIELRNQGVKPLETRQTIIKIINEILAQPRPFVLINTKSGRLCDKQKQMEVFKADPEYKQLILSPASQLEADVVWKEAIWQYFRYCMLSHTWESAGEPEFSYVEKRSVDRLAESFPNTKLQTFCSKTHEHGYWWAWSDTCCINKADREVLNMSLRSMYRWYSDSSLTIVHLKGVLRQLDVDVDALLDENLKEFVECRWNQRAWTLQEYFASRVIQFYTEDWKPYLPIDRFSDVDPINHKSSSAIKRGMQLVTGLDADSLAALKPGTDDARRKLGLASARKATRKEDMAYSLLGIFKVTIEAIYGDDEVPRALGRLLGALLTKSADVTILAWTGETSEYNTCLPAEITVYHDSESLHVPRPIKETELATSIPNMRSSMTPADLESAVRLLDRLLDAPPPELHHGRLKLPCIWFPLQFVTRDSPTSQNYTATVPLLGQVEIKTADDLPSSPNLVLVHPWFRRLLDADIPMLDHARYERALKLFAALRQPFGALLLASNHTSRDYERVAVDRLIMVQISEDVSPEQLLENIHVLYIR